MHRILVRCSKECNAEFVGILRRFGVLLQLGTETLFFTQLHESSSYINSISFTKLVYFYMKGHNKSSQVASSSFDACYQI